MFVHLTSYLHFVKTILSSCAVFRYGELFVESCKLFFTCMYFIPYVRGDHIGILLMPLVVKNQGAWAIMQHCLCDDISSILAVLIEFRLMTYRQRAITLQQCSNAWVIGYQHHCLHTRCFQTSSLSDYQLSFVSHKAPPS